MKVYLLTTCMAACACLALAGGSSVWAEEASTKDILINLDNPCGIAVQPDTGLLFVSDSAAGRILRTDLAGRKAEPAITGFAKDVYGKGPMYDIGPLGLLFLNKETLVVGGGDQLDGKEVVRIFALPEAGMPLTVDDAKHTLGPIAAGTESVTGEGNFYALAASSKAVYATSNGDDTKGWVVKFDLNDDGESGPLTTFIATKVATNVDAPVGIAMNKEGQVVVGQMGEITVPGDSLLTIYDADSGEMLHNATTGLNDIAGLAYSPTTGNLYAVDYAWADTTQGGLFRLDVTIEGETMTVKTEKICALDKPTAMAFSPDGKLYITVFGTAEEGATQKPGKVVEVMSSL